MLIKPLLIFATNILLTVNAIILNEPARYKDIKFKRVHNEFNQFKACSKPLHHSHTKLKVSF